MIALILALISQVISHATLNPPVSTGSYSQANVRISHGCNKTNTIKVTVQIPKGVTNVKPNKVTGWEISLQQRKLVVPIVSESGENITEEVDSVSWVGGNLPDNEYQDFGLAFKLPPADDGTRFYFPVYQDCPAASLNWTEIPSGGSERPRYPAPSVVVFKNGTMEKAAPQNSTSSASHLSFFDARSLLAILLFV